MRSRFCQGTLAQVTGGVGESCIHHVAIGMNARGGTPASKEKDSGGSQQQPGLHTCKAYLCSSVRLHRDCSTLGVVELSVRSTPSRKSDTLDSKEEN